MAWLQGHNALYLAEHGWALTGFDPADKAVAAAQAEAKRLGVTLDAQVLRDDQFDFGKEQCNATRTEMIGSDVVFDTNELLNQSARCARCA